MLRLKRLDVEINGIRIVVEFCPMNNNIHRIQTFDGSALTPEEFREATAFAEGVREQAKLWKGAK